MSEEKSFRGGYCERISVKNWNEGGAKEPVSKLSGFIIRWLFDLECGPQAKLARRL
ncbi:MAG: hypothetical protein P8Y80_06970 [Acidobacteriota bacterium]